MCPNNKKTKKKKVQILFHPLFSGLVTSFKISPPLLGTISEKGDETKKRDETEYETQEDLIDNFITWSLIFKKNNTPYKFLKNGFSKISSS